jgi:hypothetical protein
MDSHKFSRSQPATLTKFHGKAIPDQDLRLSEEDIGGHPYRKRGFAGDVDAIALECRPFHHPAKRQIPDTSSLSICPVIIMNDDDTSIDGAAGSVAALTTISSPSPPRIEDGGTLSDLEWGISRSACTDVHKSAPSPEPVDLDGVVFEQYI